MDQDLFDWLLLLVRWLHITVAVTWIGTSIFFMWLDRSFEKNPASTHPGHVGEVWMVHGGGFYHVEKLLMGPTKVPERLHWFKWESYWTWMSGMMLMILIFYWGDGSYLLDSMVSNISHAQGVAIGLFSLLGSWFFYDFVWERKVIRDQPSIGHTLTILWLGGMSYFLCHTLSGRAAYMHIGGMMGTWMTANVFMRIIPRQLKMVESARRGEAVNQEWGKNAKNRSTHNTYLTLPVIFVMLSNHFPMTYGHEFNWLLLLLITAAGACIREYFVVRLKNPERSFVFAFVGMAILSGVIVFSRSMEGVEEASPSKTIEKTVDVPQSTPNPLATNLNAPRIATSGLVSFEGTPPENKVLTLPSGCAQEGKKISTSNEVLVHQGRLENVLIHVVNPPQVHEDESTPLPELVLDQKGCLYHPRVSGARVGQKVTFVNSDPIFHNVRSVTTENAKFNLAMPRQNQRETKVFTKPEMYFQAKCSVHPWMGAFVGVFDHPYFAVSNQRGEFKLPPLVPGKYKIHAWHEIFGTKEFEIIVPKSGVARINVTFKQGDHP
jgi:uncharacterized membrane protein/plastocyanin